MAAAKAAKQSRISLLRILMFVFVQQQVHIADQLFYLLFLGALVSAPEAFIFIYQNKPALVDKTARCFIVLSYSYQITLFGNSIDRIAGAVNKLPLCAFHTEFICIFF